MRNRLILIAVLSLGAWMVLDPLGFEKGVTIATTRLSRGGVHLWNEFWTKLGPLVWEIVWFLVGCLIIAYAFKFLLKGLGFGGGGGGSPKRKGS